MGELAGFDLEGDEGVEVFEVGGGDGGRGHGDEGVEEFGDADSGGEAG